MSYNNLFQAVGVPQEASATVATGTQKNFTLADLQAAKELLKSLPPRPKNITFNNHGLFKFIRAAKIGEILWDGDFSFTWEGVRCFLIREQIEEYKINY